MKLSALICERAVMVLFAFCYCSEDGRRGQCHDPENISIDPRAWTADGFSVFSDVPDPRQNRYSSWKIISFWQDFFRGEQKNFCLPAPRSASTKRERKVFPSDNFFVLSAVSFSGQQNGSATGAFVSSRSEPISLATLDRDCFIIPVRSLERFLPAGVPVSRLAHRSWCD